MKDIVVEAKKIAEKAHTGVFRKWSDPPQPYIVHPTRVANKVASLQGMTPVDVAAAWCHDVCEDAPSAGEKDNYARLIEKECGIDVLTLVMELTFPTEGAEWLHKPRAEKNVIRFRQMEAMSKRAQRIKMVDRWDNLNDMENAPQRLIQKTVDESYRLLEICRGADEKMAAELKNVIDKRAKGK
jgi:(p)ppGpp synthase/HD superfamily hydrolase